jgi:SAM-dependent methyltransferase
MENMQALTSETAVERPQAASIHDMIQWRCPDHNLPVTMQDWSLACPAGHSFPIRNGIPRFVPPNTYADSFGAQWKKYRLTQLDSFTGVSITRDRTRRCLGEELWHNLAGKRVLEAGCGAGRFTEILLERGARVVSCDLSEAVDANQESFPQGENHLITQADITRLPFEPRQFDVVFCLGVLQYTADPERALASIYEHVRPGGTLVIDCYTPNLSWHTKSAPLFRLCLRRLEPGRGIWWTERLVYTLLPLHKSVRRFRPAQMILSRLSPVACYYYSFPSLSDEQQREWALLDTHNQLTGWFRHSRTRGQITRLLGQLGLENIWCEYGGNGVEARGTRSGA